ncbi:MAG TPA: hypothetical protein PLU04_10480 [Anaerolineaceae bacterium]|jgi:hypothetical protein|nr:hypothetical protein [Anaerolineaceae bacterium]HNZ01833.1 hypothetical protein [Anaerolineaceae bacterium]HOD43480.1 hypothetical protein [Anaerolineaceae bacterium]HOH21024.1 hypothetical protein [Anaerolineaceae bacterium]HOU44738.1 hypothetical protein [Anaerolineaceae bacterium]
MKRAVSVSLGSPSRDKKVIVNLNGMEISIERIGTGGDVRRAQQLYAELDGKVDCLSVGGVDLYLYLPTPKGKKRYPLRSAFKLVKDVHHTPVVDGSGLKHTLERRVFELAKPQLGGEIPHFKKAFVTMAVDRLGLAIAANEVSDEITAGDLMMEFDLPIPIRGLQNFYRVAAILLPIVSYLPLKTIFPPGYKDEPIVPKFHKYWQEADLIAGDFLYMRKHMPDDLRGKWVVTNTTTAENHELLRARGVRMFITTTPVLDGRSFGTNMMEALLTTYAGKGRPLNDEEINAYIDELEFLRPTVTQLN